MELSKLDLDKLQEALEVLMAVRTPQGENNLDLVSLKIKIDDEIKARLELLDN